MRGQSRGFTRNLSSKAFLNSGFVWYSGEPALRLFADLLTSCDDVLGRSIRCFRFMRCEDGLLFRRGVTNAGRGARSAWDFASWQRSIVLSREDRPYYSASTPLMPLERRDAKHLRAAEAYV